MNELFDELLTLFRGAGWNPALVPDEPILSVTYQGAKTGRQWVFVASADDQRNVVVFARSPVPCPPAQYGLVADFLMRCAWGMSLGAWDMDPGDGEIRFRIGVPLGQGELDPGVVQLITNTCNGVMDCTLEALEAVLAGKLTPQQGADASAEAINQYLS